MLGGELQIFEARHMRHELLAPVVFVEEIALGVGGYFSSFVYQTHV